MKARTIREGEKRLVGFPEYCCYMGLGENKAEEFAREHGIKLKIGKACRYDLRKVDAVLDSWNEKEDN